MSVVPIRGADLDARIGVEKMTEPRPRRNSGVMVALHAHAEVAIQFSAIKHRFAGGAGGPNPLRHAFFTRRLGPNARRQ